MDTSVNSGSLKSDFSIPSHDIVYCVEFCPYDWSRTLLAVGTTSRVTIHNCNFEEEKPSIDGFEYENLRNFQHACRVHAIAFSPATSLQVLNRCLKFATVGGDKKLRVFTSDLKQEDTVELLEHHTDYINAIAFDPETEDLASVSDDLTCCLWSEGKSKGNHQKWTCKAVLMLTSPGMSVSWHRDDPGKLLVAEKKGIIRFYNVRSQQPVLSLECNTIPLMAADWCPQNSLRVTAASGPECFFWDTSVSSRPSHHHTIHTEGSLLVRFSPNNQHLYSTRGRPGGQIKVVNSNTNQVLLSENLGVGNGLSWHCQLPFMAAGGDGKVFLWKILM